MLLCRLTIRRYDIAPATMIFLALTTWVDGQRVLGGTLTALGTLMKLAPALIAGPMGVLELTDRRSSRLRGSLTFLAALGFGLATWIAVGGLEGVLGSLRYHTERNLETYSLYSGLQFFAARFSGQPFKLIVDHNAWHSTTPWSPIFLRLAFPLQLASLLLVMIVFSTRNGRDPISAVVALLLGFIVFNKIGSPQYLIWVAPLVSVLEGPGAITARRLFAVCCVATSLAGLGKRIAGMDGWPFNLFVILRGLLLLAVYLWLVGVSATRRTISLEPPSAPAAKR